jgi:RNA polymerase sigma-70 factor (ECF subfamily)
MPLRRRSPSAWDAATPDEELIGWAQRGQREAFALLYDRHLGPVYGYCYRRLGDREAAQDAAAETFRKALAALPRYRDRAFRAWLFAIARNVVADHWRARRPDVPLESAIEVRDAAPSPEQLALAADALGTVVALLPRLSPDQRDAVALRLAGLSPAEIGAVLGKSRPAVDTTLHRALVRLRDLLAVEPAPAANTGGGRRG